MKASRDREKKRAGKESRPKGIIDVEFREFCRLAHQQNAELLVLLQQQRQVLLQRLGRKEVLQ
jgi:hypothetical protein